MTKAGEIVNNVLRAIRRENSEKDRAKVWSFINKHYFELAEKEPWHKLRRTVAVDFNSADTTGMWLPSNMLGIEAVRDDTNDFEFIRRDRAWIEPDEEGFRYYTYVPESEDLVRGNDLSITKGSTTFTSASLATAHTDEWITFGNEYGFYQLTDLKTFTPTYYGPSLGNAEYRIRPKGTEKLVLLDRGETVLVDRIVNIYYWICPDPLYSDSDPIMFPARPLELMVHKEAMNVILKRQLTASTYQRDLDAALKEARDSNPTFPRMARPRDNHNNLFAMDTSPYMSRGTSTRTADNWEGWVRSS